MIEYTRGNIFDSNAEALVNTVNTQGVMGKGIALQFKKRYPNNYTAYRDACMKGDVVIGKMFITEETEITGRERIIVNFPTKREWSKPSAYIYIEEGLKDLRKQILFRGIKSIAIPPLGSSNGGLDWSRVKPMIEWGLSDINCEVIVYEPTIEIIEKMKTERVRLTPARAMLLSVMCDMSLDEETPSEFAAEKIAYFLQKFGAQDQFKLKFTRGFYGPYSGKVKYVLNYLNGSYLMGMESMSNHPFDELAIAPDTKIVVDEYLARNENKKFGDIANRTKEFLRGFYSNYLLELLATTSFLMDTDVRMQGEVSEDDKIDLISQDLLQWSNRKDRLFNSRQAIGLALKHIEEFGL